MTNFTFRSFAPRNIAPRVHCKGGLEGCKVRVGVLTKWHDCNWCMQWRSTRTLWRRSLLSKFQKVWRYMCDLIGADKESTTFPALIFMKLTNTLHPYAQVSNTEFHPKQIWHAYRKYKFMYAPNRCSFQWTHFTKQIFVDILSHIFISNSSVEYMWKFLFTRLDNVNKTQIRICIAWKWPVPNSPQLGQNM